ncbi:EfeM/EfeO family lipoprotein [Actinoplanes sp. TBRC 11911]|uniref:EfeM/EfeO family lipoprotein n=1 Tax=Actinoplanes sp. TBRC 11911 TaxID=2729386 RepID=UPI00145E9FA6|nr:EfeM/EfeO family lipoprotein [Actinoplanes sp. TBRC 11911]NMO53775.1 EfeM/EfeO family lipoprotein [Actinoplanes sp. TBRC 11911]
MLRVAAVAVAVALAAAGCTGSPPAGSSVIAIDTNVDVCGGPWSAPHGGPTTFAVTNRYGAPMDVYLAGAAGGAVYQELEGIGTGATLNATVTLGNGRYRFECFPADGSAVLGPTVTIDAASGVSGTTPAVRPVTPADLIPVAKAYQAWVVGRLPVLRRQIDALVADVAAGDPAKAKADWLTAHLTYETLGAAYDAFGDLDSAINGDLTGFHKIEALLWSGSPAPALQAAVAGLLHAVDQLITQFATVDIDPNIIALRAHEIVENAIQFELNGTTDAGSHSNLATIGANLAGATETLNLLTPLLVSRYPKLASAKAALTAAQRLVAGLGHAGLDTLTRAQRENLNAELENLVELLAPIAAICDERVASQ